MVASILQFLIRADSSQATTEIKKTTGAVEGLGATTDKTGQAFSVNEKNFLRVSKTLGVDLSSATQRQIEKLEGLRSHLIATGAPSADLEKVSLRLAEAQSKLAGQLGETTKQGSGVLDFLNKHSVAIGASMTALGASIVGGLGMAAKAFGEAQQGSLQLDAALASTKGAAGLTRLELDEMAKSLSRATVFDDDALTKAQSVLLTFKGVTKDVFGSALESALDLSTRLGTDLQSAVLQVGKALDNPVQGLTALRRSGISFTEEQQAMVKQLTESGDKLGAQRIILAELSSEVGGSARKAVEGFAGQWKQLNNEMDNIVETIGGALVPVLADLLKNVAPVVRSIIDWAAANPKLTSTIVIAAGAIGGLSVVLGPLLIALPSIISLIGGAGGLAAVFTALTGPIGLAVVAIAGVGTALVTLYNTSSTFRNAVRTVWGDVSRNASDVFGDIETTISDTAQALRDIWEEHRDWLLPFVKGVWDSVKGLFEGAGRILEGTLSGGLKILAGVVQTFAGVFTADWDRFTGGIKKIWAGVWQGLSGIVDGVKIAIEATTKSFWDLIIKAYESGQKAALGLWYDLWSKLAGIVDAAWGKLKESVKSVADGVTGLFQGMYDEVVGHSIVPDLVEDIGIEFGKLDDVMGDPTKTATGNVTGLFTSMVNDLDRLLGGDSGPLGSLLKKVTGKIDSWVGGIGDKIGSLFGSGGLGSILGGLASGGLSAAIGFGITGIKALFGKIFGPDKNKLADTELVARVFPEIWRLHAEYQRTPYTTPEVDASVRLAYLSQGVEMWNELTRQFKRPESIASQRPGILSFIDAINKEFSNRTGRTATDLPVQPLAAGGIVTRPTLALIGERGPEAVVPLDKGIGMRDLVINIQQVIANNPREFIDALKSNRHDLKGSLRRELGLAT